jgi:hypothetical protein
MRRSLRHLGIPLGDLSVLKLLPLIYVAWAEGKMELVKKDRILHFASQEYRLTAAGVALLNRWLFERPTDEYITEGLHDIYTLALAGDEPNVDFSELPSVIAYAESIARSTAIALDRPETVSAGADTALERIARELHVDHGESWAKLLSKLN